VRGAAKRGVAKRGVAKRGVAKRSAQPPATVTGGVVKRRQPMTKNTQEHSRTLEHLQGSSWPRSASSLAATPT
jgi:hypothetical protein